MSGVFEQAEREQEEKNFRDYLKRLIDSEIIKGDAAGITKQVIAEGVESLSDKQKFVFNRDVMNEYGHPQCPRCTAYIPYDQAFLDPFSETDLCANCQHDDDRWHQNNP